eukprot:10509849-Karenia_brevis.AAC.1
MAAGLWGIETLSPTPYLYSKLNICVIDIAMKMYGKKWDPDAMSYALWAGVYRGRVKGIVATVVGDVWDEGLMRYYRYVGHVARQSS